MILLNSNFIFISSVHLYQLHDCILLCCGTVAVQRQADSKTCQRTANHLCCRRSSSSRCLQEHVRPWWQTNRLSSWNNTSKRLSRLVKVYVFKPFKSELSPTQAQYILMWLGGILSDVYVMMRNFLSTKQIKMFQDYVLPEGYTSCPLPECSDVRFSDVLHNQRKPNGWTWMTIMQPLALL